MANTLELGNGKWATGKDTVLAYNDLNNNFKPLPFSFSRASSATVVNKAGLIETVGSGEPRIDFKDDAKGALKLEPSRSNNILYSNDIPQSFNISSVTETQNYSVAPNGKNQSTRVQTTSSTSHYYAGYTLNNDSPYTFSIYYKGVKGEKTYIRALSTVGGTANIKLITFNGNWQREELIFTAGSSVNFVYATDNRAGVGNTATDFEVWGAQLEQGSYATSYIPTSGSAVTRLADTCSQTPPNGVIGQTEGTWFTHLKDLNFSVLGTNNPTIILDDGLYYRNSIGFASESNGNIRVSKYTSVSQSSIATILNSEELKIAIKYSSTSIAIYVNGERILNSSNTSSLYTRLVLNNATREGKFYLQDLRLYSTALTDSELQQLTTI